MGDSLSRSSIERERSSPFFCCDGPLRPPLYPFGAVLLEARSEVRGGGMRTYDGAAWVRPPVGDTGHCARWSEMVKEEVRRVSRIQGQKRVLVVVLIVKRQAGAMAPKTCDGLCGRSARERAVPRIERDPKRLFLAGRKDRTRCNRCGGLGDRSARERAVPRMERDPKRPFLAGRKDGTMCNQQGTQCKAIGPFEVPGRRQETVNAQRVGIN